jgi:hypothetical protein
MLEIACGEEGHLGQLSLNGWKGSKKGPEPLHEDERKGRPSTSRTDESMEDRTLECSAVRRNDGDE